IHGAGPVEGPAGDAYRRRGGQRDHRGALRGDHGGHARGRHLMSHRPLFALLNAYGISTLSLARVSGVDIQEIQAMVWEIAEVDPQTAELVVATLNRLTGQQLSSEQLGIHVVVEGEIVQAEGTWGGRS